MVKMIFTNMVKMISSQAERSDSGSQLTGGEDNQWWKVQILVWNIYLKKNVWTAF